MAFDDVIKGVLETNTVRGMRQYPANYEPESALSTEQKNHIAGLMRVNHAGEIAAQALYKAQAVTARSEQLKQSMQSSAEEEYDHLDWCEVRLRELDAKPSRLQPLWYMGSFGIGLLAGSFGDKWNLGFLVETEQQVIRHLDEHLQQLPQHDKRSRAILEQMRKDELKHAISAEYAGAEHLPKLVKNLMFAISRLMTTTAYRF